MIDTFNDERRAFQFRVNPLGVQADAIFSEQDGVEDFSWDMIWASVGRITAEGYFTVLFLGYSGNWQGAPGGDLGQQNRTLFVKVGYAWILSEQGPGTWDRF